MSYKIAYIDDCHMGILFMEMVAKKNGWELKSYACAETFLEKCNFEYWDVIITDFFMPGIGGLELCKILKDDKVKVPVILCTAEDSLREKIEDLPTDDFLGKPVIVRELKEMLEKWCGKRPESTT